ncbi:hypothetical protein IVB57_07480 [Bradyrhizobium sp. CW9]|uniref:hypothetical protein n=1 Tax=Bradyrhizobium sp. CW9 TaxID=2782689 RepID=UPI001FF86B59|nr:hypothetical protein [Bradyrhizobium sp. CW9]MCK1328235.1 hypothetical protein [Bradyrhizobium sp. CW9]
MESFSKQPAECRFSRWALVKLMAPPIRSNYVPVSNSPAVSSVSRQQQLSGALLLLYLLGAYTGVSIYGGGQILIPSFVCTAIACFVYFLAWHTIPKRFVGVMYVLVCTFSAQYAVSVIRQGDADGVMLRATINQVASILIGFSAIAISFQLPAERFSKTLKYFWIFLIVGATLEQFAGLGAISDAFRAAVFPKSAYVADVRDIELFGGIRPKVFSLEPSFVGLWFTATMAAWLACTDTRPFTRRFFGSIFACLWMGYLVRSSTIAFIAPLYVAQILLLPSIAGRIHGGGFARAMIATTLVSSFVLVSIAIEFLPRGIAPEFVYGDSVYGRLVAPRLVTQAVLATDPFTGTGLGNQDALFSITLPIYASSRLAFAGGYTETLSARSLVTNSFFLHWIYLGILFGLVTAFGYIKLLRSIQITSVPYVIAAVSMIWFSIGGYVTVQCWSLFFLFAAAARYRDAELRSSRRSGLARRAVI